MKIINGGKGLMKKLGYCLAILLLVIIVILGFSRYSDINTNGTFQNIKEDEVLDKIVREDEVLDKDITDLVNKSLNVQYNLSETELTSIYSSEFVEKIKDMPNLFYKMDLKPYKIISMHQVSYKIEKASIETFVFYVRISDNKGDYFQVIHMVKKNGAFIINNIEYDI